MGSAAIGYARSISAARFCWNSAVNAVLAAVILFAEAATLGLVVVWSAVRLLHLPSVLIPGLGAVVMAGTALAGVWLYRAAYRSEIANRLETSESKRAMASSVKESGNDLDRHLSPQFNPYFEPASLTRTGSNPWAV